MSPEPGALTNQLISQFADRYSTRAKLLAPVTFAFGVGVLAMVAADMGHISKLGSFYGIVVQVLPVFLVALALEQSVTKAVGTESSFVDEAVKKAHVDYPRPSGTERFDEDVARMRELFDGDLEERIDRKLVNEQRANAQAMNESTVTIYERWRLVSEAIFAIEGRAKHGGWWSKRGSVEALLALVSQLQWRPPPGVVRGRVNPLALPKYSDAFEQLEALRSDAEFEDREFTKQRARELARKQYRARISTRKYTTIALIALIAIAELLGFVGFLGDQKTQEALFPFVVGALSATVAGVSAAAIVDLDDG